MYKLRENSYRVSLSLQILLCVYGAQTLTRHILCCELIQSQNFQMAVTESFLKSKFMKKSVNNLKKIFLHFWTWEAIVND